SLRHTAFKALRFFGPVMGDADRSVSYEFHTANISSMANVQLVVTDNPVEALLAQFEALLLFCQYTSEGRKLSAIPIVTRRATPAHRRLGGTGGGWRHCVVP